MIPLNISYILIQFIKNKPILEEELLFMFNFNVVNYPQTTPDMYVNDAKLGPQITLTESVSSITWMPKSDVNIFSSTFWDKTVRIFQYEMSMITEKICQQSSFSLDTFPLTSCWNPDFSGLFVGCSDGTIKMFDFQNQSITQVGKHTAAVNHLHFCESKNLLISSAFENTIKIWQIGQKDPAISINIQNKVLCTDFKNNVMAGTTENQKIFFFDMDTISKKIITQGQASDLGISSKIQWITLDKNATRIGSVSVDGRSNISSIKKQQYGKYTKKSQLTFKVNTHQQNGIKMVFPVNCCSFHPVLDDWFMTAASDGVMNFWNLANRCRLKALKYNSNPIICAAVSPNGQLVAYGNGNDWHLGTEGIKKWENRIGIHKISAEQKQKA